MTRVSAASFPGLREFFAGYLHEDYAQEHGTPARALRAFEADASDAERRRLRAEASKLLALTESADFDELRALLETLGSRWSPRSRAAATKFLTAVADGGRDSG